MQSGPAGPAQAVELSGSLTIGEASRLHRAFLDLAAGQKDLTIGMRGVTEVDSAGLQLLLALSRALEDHGQTLRLNGLTSAVEETLRESGASRHMYHDTGVDR
jgi:anti-anti-sigma factor